MREAPVYEFGNIRVDLGVVAVFRGDQEVPLEPKAFDVLVYLLKQRDRVVEKNELLDAVWSGTFVTPNVLTRIVAQLRKALDDDAEQPKYIRTIPKHGYRFIAELNVTRSAEVSAETVAPAAVEPVVPVAPISTRIMPRSRFRDWQVWLAVSAVFLTGAVATGAWSLARRGIKTARGATLRFPAPERVTIRVGYNGMPAISPDGRTIAYVSDRSGSLEIYVVGRAPGSRELAITTDGGQNILPAWSPDGQHIAFHSERRGGIWMVPATGGGTSQIIEFGSEPAWSPDGQTIAFSSGSMGMSGQSTIWTVHADGSGRKEITTAGYPSGGHHAPSWSHDGTVLAFLNSRASIDEFLQRTLTEIWMVSLANDQPVRVAVGSLADSPAFAPRDDAIYWAGVTDRGNGRLWRVGIDRARFSATTESQEVLSTEIGIPATLSIANDGTAVFSVIANDDNLWSVAAGNDGKFARPVRLTDDEARDTLPHFSPDGRHIAFTQAAIGRPVATWVMTADGGDREVLLPETNAAALGWSQNGEHLMIFGSAGMRWIDVLTRRTAPIPAVTPGGLVAVSLSRDDREVAYHVIERDGRMNVWINGLDGGTPRRLTSDREAVAYPIWSPDGKWLAVTIRRGSNTHVGVVGRDGGAVEQLTSDAGQSWPRSWAPDSARIAFAAERDGVWNVWQVSRRTHQITSVTHFTSSTGFVRYPSWSPRGDRIVFERRITTAGVWMTRLQ